MKKKHSRCWAAPHVLVFNISTIPQFGPKKHKNTDFKVVILQDRKQFEMKMKYQLWLNAHKERWSTSTLNVKCVKRSYWPESAAHRPHLVVHKSTCWLVPRKCLLQVRDQLMHSSFRQIFPALHVRSYLTSQYLWLIKFWRRQPCVAMVTAMFSPSSCIQNKISLL